jgi:hypothetical protein
VSFLSVTSLVQTRPLNDSIKEVCLPWFSFLVVASEGCTRHRRWLALTTSLPHSTPLPIGCPLFLTMLCFRGVVLSMCFVCLGFSSVPLACLSWLCDGCSVFIVVCCCSFQQCLAWSVSNRESV